MISIVVCSVNPQQFEKLSENISSTIGCAYEILYFDNRVGDKGICAVYNDGLQKAQYPYISFCHEDVLFETNGWGLDLIKILQDQLIGLVGVAGAVYKSKYPASWVAVPQSYYRVNMVQQKKDGSKEDHKIIATDNNLFSEVSVIDGCFISGRKHVFEKYKWNSDLLKGFHLYDLDISIRVGGAYKIAVANNIKLLHFSEGDFNLQWLKESERVHKHYQNILPINKLRLSKKECKKLDYFTLNSLTHTLINLKQAPLKILRYILFAISIYPFKKQNLSLIKSFLKN